jgi:hypothetical protein
MDSSPLVSEQIEVGGRFLEEFYKHFPVQAAFWYQDLDLGGGWYLYVASDQITDENFDVVYDEVGLVAEQFHDPWFNVFTVKVIGAEHPFAKAALDLQRCYPKSVPGRFPGSRFSPSSAPEVYLYRTPHPAPAS